MKGMDDKKRGGKAMALNRQTEEQQAKQLSQLMKDYGMHKQANEQAREPSEQHGEEEYPIQPS